METTLSCIAKKPIGVSETTGMNVYQSFKANSGFNYMIGAREIEDLLIVEQFTEGTAIAYLCGVKLFRKSTNELIADIPVKFSTCYSRQAAMDIVHKALFDVLAQGFRKENKPIDLDYLDKKISDLLDKCYFEKSRKAGMDWAISLGIIKTKIA